MRQVLFLQAVKQGMALGDRIDVERHREYMAQTAEHIHAFGALALREMAAHEALIELLDQLIGVQAAPVGLFRAVIVAASLQTLGVRSNELHKFAPRTFARDDRPRLIVLGR